MNTPTSRGELNWRRTKSGTNNKYEDLTHDEDVHEKSIYNDDGFRILMITRMVLKVDAMMIMRMSTAIVKLRKNSLGHQDF